MGFFDFLRGRSTAEVKKNEVAPKPALSPKTEAKLLKKSQEAMTEEQAVASQAREGYAEAKEAAELAGEIHELDMHWTQPEKLGRSEDTLLVNFSARFNRKRMRGTLAFWNVPLYNDLGGKPKTRSEVLETLRTFPTVEFTELTISGEPAETGVKEAFAERYADVFKMKVVEQLGVKAANEKTQEDEYRYSLLQEEKERKERRKEAEAARLAALKEARDRIVGIINEKKAKVSPKEEQDIMTKLLESDGSRMTPAQAEATQARETYAKEKEAAGLAGQIKGMTLKWGWPEYVIGGAEKSDLIVTFESRLNRKKISGKFRIPKRLTKKSVLSPKQTQAELVQEVEKGNELEFTELTIAGEPADQGLRDAFAEKYGAVFKAKVMEQMKAELAVKSVTAEADEFAREQRRKEAAEAKNAAEEKKRLELEAGKAKLDAALKKKRPRTQV